MTADSDRRLPSGGRNGADDDNVIIGKVYFNYPRDLRLAAGKRRNRDQARHLRTGTRPCTGQYRLQSGNGLTALKSAANSLLDTLFGDKTTAENLYVGIVPFSQTVNVGTSHTFVRDVLTLRLGRQQQ